MAELSEKELSAINDCLKEEELLVKKFKMLAEHAEDDKVKIVLKKFPISIRDISICFTINFNKKEAI